MPRNAVLLALVVGLEMLIIAALGFWIIKARGNYSYIFTPLSHSDIESASSSSLKYYYDLATEAHTSVPEWLPYTPVYLRNKDQLNDRFDYPQQKPKGTYRIITLGDSWGFGMHVSTKDNYSERLEDILNAGLKDKKLACSGITHFDVLNLGVGGYDIEYMVERLRLRGMKYDPDLILPIIKVDDFVMVNEIIEPKLMAAWKKYGASIDAKMVNGVAVNPRQDLSKQIENEIHKEFSEQILDAYEAKALDFLDTFYHKSVLFFVYGRNLTGTQDRILRSFATQHGDTFIYDTSPVLSGDEKVPHDEHPGISGHARFARELFKFLIVSRVIPCSSS